MRRGGSVVFEGPGGDPYELVDAEHSEVGDALDGATGAALVRGYLRELRDDAPSSTSQLHGLDGSPLGGIDDPDASHGELAEQIARELESGIASRWAVRRVSVQRPRIDPNAQPSITNLSDLLSEPPGETESRTTWFEAQVVDEIGEPVADVKLRFTVDGEAREVTTGGDGKARVDDAELSSGMFQVADEPALRDAMKERWQQIRPGEWLEDEEHHTFVGLANAGRTITLRSETPHVLVVQPRVVCGRLQGMLFDTNKTFLLPLALPGVQRLAQLYRRNAGAAVLLVGHTDTSGEPDINDPLSLDRALAVQAFLTDDPAPWLAWYEDGKPAAQRWGAHEDRQMLDAVLARKAETPTGSKLRHFQQTRGLTVDGIAGPQTRDALIREYMALDDTSLPPGTAITVHGCGENFPLDESGEAVDTDAPDDASDAGDRRVELFFFDGELGVLPEPPSENSAAGSQEYPEWRKRAQETHVFIAGGEVLRIVLDDPLFGVATDIEVEITYEGREPETVVTDGNGAIEIHASRGPFADLRYAWQGQDVERRIFPALDDGGSDDGAWQRLVHLGYVPIPQPERTPPDADALADALLRFQLDYGVEPTGELDDETMNRLITAHDEDERPWHARDWDLPEDPEPGVAKPKEEVA